ncbi:MAG: hypothetical protein ACRDQX_07050 [Pseudonocardiaceae bacterium]
MALWKKAEDLSPGDEILKRPGEVVTVTWPSAVGALGVVVRTDAGEFTGPLGAELKVVAEGT